MAWFFFDLTGKVLKRVDADNLLAGVTPAYFMFPEVEQSDAGSDSKSLFNNNQSFA